MIFANVLFGITIIGTAFIPVDNYPAILTFYTLGMFAFGLIITLLFVMYTDCSEYGEWVSGRNIAALTVSASLFAIKFGAAAGSAIPGYILEFVGFVNNQAQSQEALEGINVMWNIVPAGFFFLAAILMLFYKLDRKTMLKIEHDLLERRK